MPVWGQVILAMSSIIIAVGVIWTRLLRPAVKLMSTAERILPVVSELTEQFHNAPEAFSVLADIAAQFHTDSGTTLRDVVNRLEIAADQNQKLIKQVAEAMLEQQTAAKVLQQNVEVAKRLAEQDRQELAEAISILRKVRIGVADAADVVAASQGRADAVVASTIDTEPGAAADAASGSAGGPADGPGGSTEPNGSPPA